MLHSKFAASRSRLTSAFIHPTALLNPPLFLVLTAIALLAGLRFIHLSADFPLGISAYGMTYSDEGWWARNAIALIREGQWYIDDGYNTVFNLPVLPLIQVAWFKLFGVSLASARSITALSVVAVSGLVYAIARFAEQNYRLPANSPLANSTLVDSSLAQRKVPRPNKSGLAWLAPFIVLSSYPVFVYSRLALLELPMMVMMMVSLWLAVTAETATKPVLKQVKVVGSAIFLALAVLIKTTALFGLPTILLLLYLQPGKRSQKIRTILMWLLVFAAITIPYTYIYSHGRYALSYRQFSGYNVEGKLHSGLVSLLLGPLRVIKYSVVLFPLLFISLVVSLATLIKSKPYRTHRAFQISLIWSLSALAAFSTSSYAAPRYFLIWIVPVALSLPLAIACCWNWASTWRKNILIALLVLSTLLSLFRISAYVSTPKFSFANMSARVEAIITENPEHSPVLMGHFADTLSLAENIKTINDRMGYRELYRRIEIFNPGYYISVGDMQPFIAETMDKYYAKELIETFDVYENYDYGLPVHFYRLEPYDWWTPERE